MGLLLHITKSYFFTGTYVIHYSGFCFLKGLIQLINKGVFACDIIKKRIYCPSMVPGNDTEDNFWGEEVEETDTIKGTVDDGIYNLWGTEEPTYVMRTMATGG